MIKLLIPFLLVGIVLSTGSDFLVNLPTDGGAKPFISVDRFFFGSVDYTIMFHVQFGTVSGTRTILYANTPNVGHIEDDGLVIVDLVNGNQLGVCFGKFENYRRINLPGSLSIDNLYAFRITVSNAGDGNVHVLVKIGSSMVTSATIRGRVAQGFRVMTIGAANVNGIKGNFLDGMIDNVVFAHQSISSFTANDFITNHRLWSPDASLNQIALWIHFNDAILAVDNSAVGITTIETNNAEWVLAQVHDGGLFQNHGNGGSQWRRCYVTGDPHYYDWNGVHIYGGESLFGEFLYERCIDEDLEIRTHTRMCTWWGATIFRVVSIKYKDHLFRINQAENVPGGNVRQGWPNTQLGLTRGKFYKRISAYHDTWQTLGEGVYIHQDSSVRLNVHGGGMVVAIPDIATINVQYGDTRYMNIYLDMNWARCTNRQGACERVLNIGASVLFNDLLGPTPLPDTPQPEFDVCDSVKLANPEIYRRMKESCKYYYPNNAVFFEDCLYDACASGDPDAIPDADLTPECQLERLTGIDNPSCTENTCPGACFGRGECVSGSCVCNSTTHGGFDCFQQNSFMCNTVTYGASYLNVEPRTIFQTQPDNLRMNFHEYSVRRSILVYPATYAGASYLQVIANSPSSESAGAATICFTLNSGATPGEGVVIGKPLAAAAVAAAKPILVEFTGDWASEYCAEIKFPAYSVGGFYFETTTHDFTVRVINKNNLDQVLIGSQNGRGGLDIAKIPNAHHSGFSYVIEDCDNQVCYQHDEDCSSCYQEPGCGFCLETQRCMRGDNSGPKRGLCENWRVSLDEDVSRVVTIKYNGDDLVDPDTQVFLSSIGVGSTVPATVYVPTGRTNENIDLHFIFSVSGTYATNAEPLKSNLLNSLFTAGRNMNLGLGYYGNVASINTLDPLRTDRNNQYWFARALEAPGGLHTTAGVGGQFSAITKAAQEVGFRQFARRLIFITVYDIPTDSTGLSAAREAVLDKQIFVVFVIPNGVATSVVDYYNNLNTDIQGIPSLVLRLTQTGSDFLTVFRTAFSLSASYPHVVIRDVDDDQFTHVDLTTLSTESDSLAIAGLTHVNMRARFSIPMKKGDNSGSRVAEISIPGFGHSYIEDVPSTQPTITGVLSYSAPEDTKCVEVTLDGRTFENLFEPVFEIVTLPTVGTLYEKDDSQPFGIGAPASTTYYTRKTFCFQPLPHDHSVPAAAVYDSFSYRATDGCKPSPTATIDIYITPVFFPPLSDNIFISLYETEQASPVDIDIIAYEYDKDNLGNKELVDYIYSYISVEYNTVLFGAAPTGFFQAGGLPLSTDPSAYTGFLPDSNWETLHTIQYVAPSQDFFGTFYAYLTLHDNGPATDSNYKIVVDVIPINDQPTAGSVGDAVFDPTGVHQFVQEDNTYTLTITGQDIDNFDIGVDVQIVSQAPGSGVLSANGNSLSTVGQWINDVCRSGPGMRTIICDLTFVPTDEYFSCNLGNKVAKPDYATVTGTCTPALVIKYRVNDHNDLYLNAIGGDVDVLLSAEGTVNLHVLQVNDPPLAPENQDVYLLEDDSARLIEVLVQDIDSVPEALDLYLREVCASSSIVLTQTNDDVITGPNALINDAKKRIYEQLHAFVATPQPDVHGGSIENDFLLCQLSAYSFDTNLTSTTDAVINIFVKPQNDAPYNLLVNFTKDEDYEGEFAILDLTADDIDTPAGDLTYVITQLPFSDPQSSLGVFIYALDENGNPETQYLTQSDLPYTVQLNSENEAKVYMRNIADWYGILSADEDVLIYTVTDVDSYLPEDDVDYIQNIETSKVTIVVKPVNDRPITTVQPPSGYEDVVQLIYLLGEDPKFGEDDELDVEIEDMDVVFAWDFEGTYTVFYHYDEAWYNAYLDDPTITTLPSTPLEINDAVTDEEFRILFVPPKNLNIEESAQFTPNFIKPSLKYRMVETFSLYEPIELRSVISDWVDVTVLAVNDVPVTWGGEWNTLPETSYFYGGYNSWTYPIGYGDDVETHMNTVCVDDCYFTEDFGQQGHIFDQGFAEIKFGGRDVEGDNLDVVIRAVDCLEGARFQLITETQRVDVTSTELVGMTLSRQLIRQSTGYQLTSLLAFSPAVDDWNQENPDEAAHIDDQSGTLRDSYCTIDYVVVDSEGIASDANGTAPKRITLQVLSYNDQPTDVVLSTPGASSNIIGYEDQNTFIRFDAFDKEGDDFFLRVESCGPRGTFYYPSVDQALYIDEDTGALDTSAPLADLFNLDTPVDCSSATSLESNFFSYSNSFYLGWYILFVPEENDFAADYNQIVVSYDDEIRSGQPRQLSSRSLVIREVNDAPVVLRNGDVAVDGELVTVKQNTPQNLNFEFSDVDAITTSGSEFPGVGFRIAVSKVTPTNPNFEITEAPHTYELNYPGGNQNAPATSLQIKPWSASSNGFIQWRSSVSQANDLTRFVTINFHIDALYELEVAVIDVGRTGYCGAGVVVDTTVYEFDDLRNTIAANGELIGGNPVRCNRVGSVVINVQANADTAVIGGIATGAGAGLLALVALGAILFAKLKQPEDLNAWEALDNAQITNAQQSGIHVQAMNGGTSALYESKKV